MTFMRELLPGRQKYLGQTIKKPAHKLLMAGDGINEPSKSQRQIIGLAMGRRKAETDISMGNADVSYGR
ncbi:hypothetical protein [Lentibacillus sp. CBA3610]|uniref:hypothetical protein n=1 Tax=Lentibacillus sp. CBA3610 TaxID=2518176 RepID=UPI0015961C79|nr:hypothetical protein [Lentibacillus sp. CBA3610]